MFRLIRSVAVLSLLAALAACGSKEVKRINPPDVSVQSLAVAADSATLSLRVHNHSDVTMTFGNFDLKLRLATNAPFSISSNATIEVSPHTAEIIDLQVNRNSLSTDALKRLEAGEMVAYSLFGQVESLAPKSRLYDLSFEARLSAVPGKPGEYR
ncbi:hypothetical protein [Ahniella affigens]|nr:hypothetical protein [Ahniella affigens]